LARALGGAAGADGMPRLLSHGLETQARRHYSPVHVAARLAQLDELTAGARAHEATVAAAAARLAVALAPRLWLPPALVQRLHAGPAQTLATLRQLLARAQACRGGFALLPVDEQLPAVAPPELDLARTAA
jgi:MoxR-like ATPase